MTDSDVFKEIDVVIKSIFSHKIRKEIPIKNFILVKEIARIKFKYPDGGMVNWSQYVENTEIIKFKRGIRVKTSYGKLEWDTRKNFSPMFRLVSKLGFTPEEFLYTLQTILIELI